MIQLFNLIDHNPKGYQIYKNLKIQEWSTDRIKIKHNVCGKFGHFVGEHDTERNQNMK